MSRIPHDDFIIPLDTNHIPTAMANAKMDWTADVHPAYSGMMRDVPDGMGGTRAEMHYEPLADSKVIRRSDTGKVISTVGRTFTPLQNVEAFDFFQPFLDAGHASLSRAFCLDGGARIVLQAKMTGGTAEIVPGDTVERFLTLAHGHDGSLSVNVGFTPQRPSCRNILHAITHQYRALFVRIRHGRNVKRNVDDLRTTVDMVNGCFLETENQYRALAGRTNITEGTLRQYVKTVYGMESDDNKLSTRTSNTIDAVIGNYRRSVAAVKDVIEAAEAYREAEEKHNASLLDMVLSNMEGGRGTENAPSRGSWWTAYNAVTEHLTHTRGRTDESRMNSNLFGANSETNRVALETAMQMSGLVSA